MKKIALVIPTLNGGGAEKNILLLSKFLDRKKYQIDLIVFNLEGRFVNKVPNDIKVLNLNKQGKKALYNLYRVIKKNQYTLVLSTIAIANLYLGFLKIIFPNIKFIAREANMLSIENHGNLFNFLYKILVKKLDLVIAQSLDMKKDLEENYNIKNIIVINNPIEKATLDMKSKRLKSKLRFISVGRLSKQKGYENIIDELKNLKIEFEYFIYGEGPDREILLKKIEENFLKDKVFLKGFSYEVEKEISRADFLLLPSLHEGFPNILLESISLGIPVISNKCKGGIDEIINKDNGIVYDSLKKGDFEEKLLSVINKEFDSELMKKDIEKKYSIEKIMKEYEKTIDLLIERGE